MWQNSECDETQELKNTKCDIALKKIKMWQIKKTWNVKKKTQNSECDIPQQLKCDKTKNSKYDKTKKNRNFTNI